MSTPLNCGIITANKPLDPNVIESVWGKDGWEVNGKELEITEFYAWNFAEDLYLLFNEFGDDYIFNGEINYYDDSYGGDGRYDIVDNVIEYIPQTEFALHDATDEELIEILENRGYTVIKKGN